MNEILMFVYGTLRKGFNNNYLLKNATFIGNAVTEKEYALYAQGIPYVTDKEKVSQVIGEVWAVDEKTLERLDRLEGHPDWYCREETPVILTSGDDVGSVAVAWLYFYDRDVSGKVLVESGDYKVYCDEHARMYIKEPV